MNNKLLMLTSMLLCSISSLPSNFNDEDAYQIFTDEQMKALQEARSERNDNYNQESREEYNAKFRDIFPELFENEHTEDDN